MIIFLLVFTFNIASAFSQTAVTLFEFGINRLASGISTRPLSPLGTASDKSETTYLYEIVDPAIATNGAAALITSSRTIVASASGWAEHFGTTASIECKFIDSTEGICFGAATGTATGTPSPVVLEVASTTPTQATRTTLTQATSTAPTSTPSTTPTTESQPNPTISQKSSAGIIAGSTIAGVVVLSVVVAFILWRRKRSRRPELLVEQFNTE
ncbi:hypothetical protein BDP27DRAFT_951540 [Rhodocollybia butyracea]|uniref:Mid2 domain-containing protein n=1 Tax=Rhodocollybia butyracea TaxID=206335 RepID=A0A9P5Q6W1_9AGAR|nr:hypothetical protein BDP27DRAFT_951540 [Rhodocollybia butyracea]